VRDGLVRVDGRAMMKPASLVGPTQLLEVDDLGDQWVSRAAHKLVAALDEFGIDPRGMTVVDAGASTGGFSHVLLARGARRVIAVDVGHGQISPQLAEYQADGRLTSIEGMNVRDLAPAFVAEHAMGREVDLVVGDLSFISLRLVIPPLVTAAPLADLILLIKPQFEVGRGGVKEGIVRDAGLREDAIMDVLWSAHDAGLKVAGLAASPITGTHGNVEFLTRLSPRVGGDPSEWSGHAHRLART